MNVEWFTTQQSFKTSKNGSLGSLGQFVWIKDTMVHSFACMERIEQEDQCGMVPGTPMVRDKQGSLPWFTCVVRTLGKRFVPPLDGYTLRITIFSMFECVRFTESVQGFYRGLVKGGDKRKRPTL